MVEERHTAWLAVFEKNGLDLGRYPGELWD
jgi:hypothetical protein